MTIRFLDQLGREAGGGIEGRGYAMEVDGEIYVPLIQMPNEGRGEGGRFLDSLPKDKTIKVPGVINRILAGMLERRGFHIEQEWVQQYEEWADVYVRRPNA